MRTRLSESNAVEQPKLHNQALCLYFIFHHQVAFQDFFMPIGTRRFFKTRFYQYAFSLAETGVLLGGRAFGKSICLNARIMRGTTIYRGVESLLTAFRRTHVRDRIEDVISYILNIPYLRQFLAGDPDRTTKGSITRTPIYSVKFKNGHILTGISVGDDPNSVMIQGHHPLLKYGDEMAWYPRPAWTKFQETADPKGTIDFFTGCKDGKLDTPFRQMDGRIEKYRHHRFSISRIMEPWWNQKIKRERIEAFGSETSNEYLNQIMADWGEPVVGLWSEADIRSCFDKSELRDGVYTSSMRVIAISPRDYKPKDAAERSNLLVELFYEIPGPDPNADVIFAIDAGYSAPTEILILVRDPRSLKWVLRTRVELIDRVMVDHQADCIDFLDSICHPKWIAIDCSSGEGKAVASALANPLRTEFADKGYSDRIVWVEFQKKMVVSHKLKDGVWTPVEESIKNHTTTILQGMFARQEFLFSFDEQLLVEFMAEGKRQARDATTSERIATPSWVHCPEALRTFAYVFATKYTPMDDPTRTEDWAYDPMLPEFGESGLSLFGR